MACGYAMYTDKLGVCFATAGPGAFNLFSGLAVAMSDSYPVLAVSGYASLDWKGRGSLNETSGLNRTPELAGDVRGDDQGVVPAHGHRRHLRRARGGGQPRLRGPAGPGPHPRAGEPDPPRPVRSTNYRDIRLNVAPVLPDPARVERGRGGARRGHRAAASGSSLLVGFGAVRSGAPSAEVSALVERFQIPLADDAGRQGHHLRRATRCASACSATAATPAPGRRSARPTSCCAVGNSFNQHATFNYREDLFDGKTLIHVNITADEIGKELQGRPRHRLGRASRPSRRCSRRSPARSARSAPARRSSGRTARSATSSTCPARSTPASSRRRSARMLPRRTASCSPTPARTRPGSATTSSSRTGRTSASPASFGPMAGHINGALGLKVAHPDRTGRRRLRRRRATCCRASS